MATSIDTQYFTRLERVSAYSRTDRGILATVDRETLRVDVVRDDIMRVKISRAGIFDETPTFAVSADLADAHAAFEIAEDAQALRVRTARMTLTIWKAPFALDAHRADGSVIFETLRDAAGDSWAYATLNDEFIIRRVCRWEDAFFGLGEKTGAFNRRGRDFILWNADVLNPSTVAEFGQGMEPGDPRADATSTLFDPYYISIPFFYHMDETSGRMAGMFFDNGYRGQIELARADEYRVHFAGGQYSEYIFGAPAMRDILAAYTWLTGRMAPPPLWALGYHQCRWQRYTQDDILNLAARHREKGIPCDALWLDIEYMRGYRVFTWNEQAFPDPAAMLARLAEQGFRAITIIDPGVKYEPGYWVFDQAIARDVLCKTEGGAIYAGQVWPGKTAFPDFVAREARDWWGELNAAHVRSGLAGIWNDMNEPATGAIPPDAMRFDGGKYSHERYHNQYALLMAMGTTDGLRRAMPDKRTFVLSRAGSAGIQRYAANWMGDNCSRWDHLALSIAMGAGLGVSGQPFVGADIGGFHGHSNAELFLRWMQYGVLTPFCRNHNEYGNIEQYVWSFGPVIEELCRQALQLRYRLLPYLYTTFMRSAESGDPVQQPLIFAYQNDRTVRDIDDQYLLGGDLLVAPVTQPGTLARQVYLPEGTWYRWGSEERFSGRGFQIAPTPLDSIPFYARGGAIIPLWHEAPLSTDGYYPEQIELHVFVPAEDGIHQSFLHEDDGLTFACQAGAYLRTGFTLERRGARLTIAATVSGNGYPEHARRAFVLKVHGAPVQAAQCDGAALQIHEGAVTIANSGADFGLTIDLG